MTLFSRIIIKINLINLRNRISPITFSQFHSCQHNFAGHSKWANIRHIKALKDGQKSVSFIKLSRQIRLAIQDGGSSNPALNSNLKNMIDFALKKNMPMATIQSTIKKCDQSKLHIKRYLLEMRVVNKIYMVCVLYTDNFAGSKMNLAPILRKAGASYVESRHLFTDRGVVEAKIDEKLKSKAKTEMELEELCTVDAIEMSAEEVDIVDYENGLVNFICNPIELNRISTALTEKGYSVESSDHLFIPKACVNISENDLKAYEIFRNKLIAFDGIEEIYDNIQPLELSDNGQ